MRTLMLTATQVLLDEHARIRSVLRPALEGLPALETGGPEALPGALPALKAWAEFSTGGLVSHAHKEDEILFPAVEHELGTTNGPTEVMRREHQEIHALARRFVETLGELRDRDHPALMAGVGSFNQALDRADSGRGSLADVTGSLRELADTLEAHFEKEEQVLFPLVESLLPPTVQQELGTQLMAFPSKI